MGSQPSTLHKDLSVVTRLYGSLGHADTGLDTVTISSVTYLQKYIGTLPQNAMLVPGATSFLVDTALADAGAQVTVGTVDDAVAFTATTDITAATTGWYPGVAASIKAGLGAIKLAADTPVYIYYVDTAGTTITAGNVDVCLAYVHSNAPGDIA